jgi:hypothetical protein
MHQVAAAAHALSQSPPVRVPQEVRYTESKLSSPPQKGVLFNLNCTSLDPLSMLWLLYQLSDPDLHSWLG